MSAHLMPDGRPFGAYRPRSWFGGLVTVTGPCEDVRLVVRRNAVSQLVNKTCIFSRHRLLDELGRA